MFLRFYTIPAQPVPQPVGRESHDSGSIRPTTRGAEIVFELFGQPKTPKTRFPLGRVERESCF